MTPSAPNTTTESISGSSSSEAVAGEKKFLWFSYVTWYQILALLAVSVAAVIVGGAFDREMEKFVPESVTLTSTYNRKPSGLSALNEIAQKAGLNCRTWESPYRQLSDITRGALVIVDPNQSLQEFECEQILNWVHKGNQLIFVDQFVFQLSRQMLEKLSIRTEVLDEGLEEISIEVDHNKPEFQHIEKLVVSADTLLKGGREILTHDDKGAIFVQVEHGEGTIVVGSAPSIWSNRRLMKKESWPNYQLFVNLLSNAKGQILFDERCHGFTGASNVFIVLARGWVGLIVAQLLLMLAVACVSNWQRFGAPEIVNRARKISNLEFIFGLANAYRRARANTTVLEIIGQSFRHRMCKDAGVSPHDPNDKLIEAWRNFGDEADAGNLAAYLADYDRRLQEGHLSDNELKALIATLDKISERSKELVSKRK